MRRENCHPDYQSWGLLSALSLLLIFELAEPALRWMLVYFFKLTGNKPSESFINFYVLFWPLITDLLLLIIIGLYIKGLYGQPFRRPFGWSWPSRLWMKELGKRRFSPRQVSGSAGMLVYSLAVFCTALIPGPETSLSAAVESSILIATGTTLAAVVGAPLIEELLFRGVLYPALLRRTGYNFRGKCFAVAGVSALFLAIHISVYSSKEGVPHVGHLTGIALAAVAFTSMRAYSQRILPSYFMHLIFNVCGSTGMFFNLFLKSI
jgi:membrane protease YdiL (CAAX protease family)